MSAGGNHGRPPQGGLSAASQIDPRRISKNSEAILETLRCAEMCFREDFLGDEGE